jgi:hypothetical protein
LKEITLISATTEVTLRASDTDKGLEIDVKGLGQRVSIQREGKELASQDADGKWIAPGFTGPLTGAVTGNATTATNLVAGTPVIAAERTFTEAGAGSYTATVTIPAGSTVLDVYFRNTVLWTAATSAALNVGDGDDADGYFTAIDVKAAPAADTATVPGGVSSLLQGAGSGAYKGVQKYYPSAGMITATIVSVGAGTAGRSRLLVTYMTPVAVAATKV